MAIALDPKQVVSSEGSLMSQAVLQEVVIRLPGGKGMFSKEEFFGNGESGEC